MTKGKVLFLLWYSIWLNFCHKWEYFRCTFCFYIGIKGWGSPQFGLIFPTIGIILRCMFCFCIWIKGWESINAWQTLLLKKVFWKLRACLVINLKLTFLHFKQHYIHFHTLFHPHVFQKTTNNLSQTTLPNTP